MHNNYYLLQHLSSELDSRLSGFRLGECFSQNKDELILGFYNHNDEFYIKATLTAQFSCLSFPSSFERAKKNTADLFEELYNKEVIGVHQFLNERCLSIQLEDDYQLLFKLHGNRSNIILVKDDAVQLLFKNKLKNDLNIDLTSLNRPINQEFETFEKSGYNYHTVFPTFGRLIKRYLEAENYANLEHDEQWRLLHAIHHKLSAPIYYLIDLDGEIHLSLIPTGKTIEKFENPIEALNGYFLHYIRVEHVGKERQRHIATLTKQLQQGERYCDKLEAKLDEIVMSTSYKQIADIIMANMHAIQKGAKQATLFNFYTNEEVNIKLKQDSSPQKNAENYYRKSKNQRLEIEKLEENIANKRKQMNLWLRLIEELEQVDSFKELKNFIKKHGLSAAKKSEEEVLPYKAFEVDGFHIWVGKNAKANDRLTLKYAHKDDLWLHAKDVSGSHVVIKQQSGRSIPKNVLEKAASLAAYYSKRKMDSLCPVSYTTKKFVRKPKGFPAGAVMVDREDVILVEPKPPV